MKMKTALRLVLMAAIAATPITARPLGGISSPRRIEVTAKRFEYSPSTLTLKRDEPVVLVIHSADVPHGLRIRDLGVLAKVGKGATVEVPFTPTKTGTFTGQCSVFCGSGHGSMKLTVQVVN